MRQEDSISAFLFIRALEVSFFKFFFRYLPSSRPLNLLSANPTKWPNTLKLFVGNLRTNYLSVFDHFVGLVLKRIRFFMNTLRGIIIFNTFIGYLKQ